MKSVALILVAFQCLSVHSATSSKTVFDAFYSQTVEIYTSAVLSIFQLSPYRMKYCPSMFRSTENEIRDSLLAIANRSKDIPVDDGFGFGEFDQFCRLNFECDVRRKTELNRQYEIFNSFVRSCECERQFRESVQLERNDWISGVQSFFGHIYALNRRKCYSVDHPIKRCKRFESFYTPRKQYDEFEMERFGTESIRCIEYELDKTKPKIYQLFDIPFQFERIAPEFREFIEYVEMFSYIFVFYEKIYSLF